MAESTWYVAPDGTAVETEDESVYDEALGPVDPHQHPSGLLVEDDEGSGIDTTAQAVAHEAFGRQRELSAEEAAVHVVENPT